jgi:hypothetical protein
MKLLPTTTARDHKGSAQGFTDRRDGGPDLEGAIMRLLPTPLTTDAQGAGGHGDGGRDLRTTVVQDWNTEAWAEYLPAVLAWCKRTNAAPPVPVEINSNGNLRIAAKFSEWMMGWPTGWVTELITTNRRLYKEGMISRTAAMRMIGNGVVPQQATMAIGELMETW